MDITAIVVTRDPAKPYLVKQVEFELSDGTRLLLPEVRRITLEDSWNAIHTITLEFLAGVKLAYREEGA